MADPLSPDVLASLQTIAAIGRRQIERHLFPWPLRGDAWRLTILRAIGAVGIGVFSAGLAVLLIVVILNLVFHYGPA